MGYLTDPKSYINDNIFKFEQRLESQYTVFLDKNPTFVTYYHINNINSTTDNGFKNVDKIMGTDSPLKFQKIDDFPIYGLDQIVLNLNDDEEGLTTSFESEGIILPNTIKPLPNDIFTISYLGTEYIFMISQISYDTIKSNNFYSVSFYLRATDGADDIVKLQNQVIGTYKCIFNNIGTEDKCIIESDMCDKINAIETACQSMISRYRTLFYNSKFNSLVVAEGNKLVYDKYITHFISKNRLLDEKNSYNTLQLSNEDDGTHFILQYEDSIFDAIEQRDITRVSYVKYSKVHISYQQSVFHYYNAHNFIESIAFVPDSISECAIGSYIDDDLISNILSNNTVDTRSFIDDIIIKYFNNDSNTIHNINVSDLLRYRIRHNNHDFRIIPILLFILRHTVNKFLHV